MRDETLKIRKKCESESHRTARTRSQNGLAEVAGGGGGWGVWGHRKPSRGGQAYPAS